MAEVVEVHVVDDQIVTVDVPASEPDVSVVEVLVAGPQGPKGEHGDNGTAPVAPGVEFFQAQPSASWLIPHTFGRRPSITLYDENDREFLADVVGTSTTVLVELAYPMSGRAVLV